MEWDCSLSAILVDGNVHLAMRVIRICFGNWTDVLIHIYIRNAFKLRRRFYVAMWPHIMCLSCLKKYPTLVTYFQRNPSPDSDPNVAKAISRLCVCVFQAQFAVKISERDRTHLAIFIAGSVNKIEISEPSRHVSG